MKAKVVLLTLFLCMMAMSVGAQAQIDYDEGFEILPSNYIAPKMDCVRSGTGAGQQCALLAYDNTSKKLELFTTSSRFLNDSLPLTPNQTVLTDSNHGHIIGMNPATAIPYDIHWNASGNFLIYDGTTIAKKFSITNGVVSTIGNSVPYTPIMAGDRTNDYFWSALNSTNGGFYRMINSGFSSSTDWGNAKAQNWLGTGGGDYIGGLHLEAENGNINKTYIFYPYNSTSGGRGYSNNTDAIIGAARYDGIFEREREASSYEYFMRNGTDVIRYDTTSNQTQTFFEFSGNVVISQSLWMNYLNVNDIIIIFENSSGINLYNAWSSLYTAVPDEYNESVAVEALTPDFFLGLFRANNPHFPKIACSPDFGSCAMLVYDTGILSTACGGILPTAGLKLYYTLTPDQPNWQCEYVFPESYDVTTDYSPPYDIRYNTADGKFRIVSGLKLYEWDGAALPVNTMTYSLVFTNGQNRGFGFADEEGDEVIAIIHNLDLGYPYYRGYLVTTAWNSQAIVNILWSCSVNAGMDGCAIVSASGSATYDGTNIKYELRYYDMQFDSFPSVNWYGIGWTTTSNLAMTDDHDYTEPYQYYYPEEGIVFFERDIGDTPNDYGNGIYYSGHNPPTGADWIYPTVTPYYAYNDLYAEDTDAISRYFEEQKIYAVAKRATNYDCLPFVGCGKVLYHAKANNPVSILTEYIDPDSNLTDLINTSMTLECLDTAINYTISSGAAFDVFNLPCNSNINLTLQTIAAYPFFSEINFDFFAGCSYMSIEATYIKSFESVLTVRDEFDQTTIAGATVYIEGTPYITDANGQLSRTVAPTNAVFEVTSNVPACTISMSSVGTANATKFIIVDKAGYRLWSGFVTFSLTEDPIVYLEKGESIYTSIEYNDGVPVTGEKSGYVRASGGSQIFIIENNIPVEPVNNESNVFPIEWRVVGSTPYSINLTLVWGNHTESKIVSIVAAQSGYDCDDNACFTLPFASDDPDVFPTSADCEESFCIGDHYFKELTGYDAGAQQCVYDTIYCPTYCDPEEGCYTTVSNRSCDFDSQCFDLIECITDWVFRDAVCSEELGVCITEHVSCPYGCEDGACVGAPVVPTCDQSTVAGMLACTQAGIMGFIGVTYDPMFMILVVIAIVVIFVTLLSLAVKGVSNVIR